jgi:hypothetical protein
MIEIKNKTKKKQTKKAAVKKTAVKKPSNKKAQLDDVMDEELFKEEKDIDLLFGGQLDDEAKRAMIRARIAMAQKQERLNDVARSKLVEKSAAAEEIIRICNSLNEQLTNFPDEMTPQLHKRTPKEIRSKLVKKIDSLKKSFIQLIEAKK